MGILIYDVNSYLQNNLPAPYTGIDIQPMVGAADTAAPHILYHWLPSKRNVERYYIRRDFIIYNIYDTDAERLFDITNEMEKLFNLADTIQGQIPSDDNRTLWCEWRGGTTTAPIMREGWYKMSFEIWVGYVPLA